MKNKLIEMIKENKNNVEIAKELNCCVQTITRTIKRENIEDTRKKSQKRSGRKYKFK